MRTEDDARHRPIPGDLHICHYASPNRAVIMYRFDGPNTFTNLRLGTSASWSRTFWAASGLCTEDIAAGGFERWIPAPEVTPEVTPEVPARDPATHPQVCDRWAHDAPEGAVDIEVLEVRPNKVGFRYGASYLNWSPGGFADICKHWRLVCPAAPEVVRGGNP